MPGRSASLPDRRRGAHSLARPGCNAAWESCPTCGQQYTLQDQGKPAEAEAVYRPTLAAQQRVLGPEHASKLVSAYY